MGRTESIQKIVVKKDIKMEIYIEYSGSEFIIRKIQLYGLSFWNNEILTLNSICRFFVSGRLFEKGGIGGVGYSLYFEKDEEEKKVKNIYLIIIKKNETIRLSRLQSERVSYCIEYFLRQRKHSIDLFEKKFVSKID